MFFRQDNEGDREMTVGAPTGSVPYLTTEQMIEVDRAMMEDYQIELVQMMEMRREEPGASRAGIVP